MDLKRLIDIVGATLGIVILFPLFMLIAILIAISSKGPIFFRQTRVGLNMEDFNLIKFRTMYVSSENKSLLTIGSKDSRVTKIGYYLRKYKLDEFPQLFNVLRGEMSLVGPRPEVRKYVNLYDDDQRYVLSVKPGITDLASVEFFNESDLLAKAEDPESYYIQNIIPIKIDHNLRYVANNNVATDLKIIWMTFSKIIIN